jgi:hypothetical protein
MIRKKDLALVIIAVAGFLAVGCSGGSATFTQTSSDSRPGTFTISGIVSGMTRSGVVIGLSGDSIATTTTDSQGAYVLPGVGDGAYVVTPSLANYRFTPVIVPVTVAGSDVSGVNFNDVGDFEISGVMRGSVVAGVAMMLSGATSSLATTDANRNYRFSGLDAGSYVVTPDLTGYVFVYASRAVLLSNGSSSHLDFASMPQAGPLYSISGNVGGDVSEGVTVFADGPICASIFTDAAGNYSLTSLPSGSYHIQARKNCYSALPWSRTTVITTASVTSADFAMTSGTCSGSKVGVIPYGSVSGTVSGAVQQGVTMILTGPSCSVTTTDANGNYFFSYPAYVHTVTPAMAGYTFSPVSRNTSGGDQTGFDFTAL